MTDKLQINNVIEAVLEEHVAATRSQRIQIRELLLDAIEQAGFFIGENVRSDSDNVGNLEPAHSDLTYIPVKRLTDLENMYNQTVVDPNADNDYLRGYNNGIRLAHATINGHEPHYIEPLHVTEVRQRPQPNDYARPDHCSEDGTRYTLSDCFD